MFVFAIDIANGISSSTETEVDVGGVAITRIVSVDIINESNIPPLLSPDVSEDATNRTAQVIQNEEWDFTKHARYKELARQEALKELSVEEQAELELLSRLRRLANYPRSSEEILWQRRQQQLTQNLVSALESYVHFHKPADCP